MRWLLIGLVRLYQIALAPFIPPSCRFHPSCSEYMIDALRWHGPFRGLWLGTRRLLRCHPFCEGGIDFVPPPPSREENRHPPGA